MTAEQIQTIVNNQKAYFKSGATLNIKTRLRMLKSFREAIKADLDAIHAALEKDLGKSASESYMCETGLALSELSFMIKHLKGYAKPKRVKTPLAHAVAKSYRLASPFGTVLVLSPWNYPFLLAIDPVIDAVAAGNTVVLKTSSSSPNAGEAIKAVIEKVFPPEYVAVIPGGGEANDAIAAQTFDYIFFTGSKAVGTKIYENAAKTLTPVTLELGGKSPCIVDETAKIALAARRIVWGKYLNAGQTCVAPDYVMCNSRVRDRLVEELKKQIEKQFGKSPLENAAYGKMINKRHYDRVMGLIDGGKTVCGGKGDAASLKIEPTVMIDVTLDAPVMQEEIFGPVLPILTYDDDSEIIEQVSNHDAPLAFYVFSSNRKRIKRLTTSLGFGGGCINDTVIHLATPHMAFGGFGASGLGSYHGKSGFDTFSHYKSIVNKRTWIDLAIRYRPYGKSKDALVKLFLK